MGLNNGLINVTHDNKVIIIIIIINNKNYVDFVCLFDFRLLFIGCILENKVWINDLERRRCKRFYSLGNNF